MTTSLEVSKELWERGVRLDTSLFWLVVPDGEAIGYDKPYVTSANPYSNLVDYVEYPAPLLHELLEIMPDHVTQNGKIYYTPELVFGEIDEGREYGFIYVSDSRTSNLHSEYDTNPADCVAKCLIYLIDNNFVQIKDGKVV